MVERGPWDRRSQKECLPAVDVSDVFLEYEQQNVQ
jgi:hypothetical protein